MAVGSSAPASNLELMIARYEAILQAVANAPKDKEAALRELLLVRDRLAGLLRESETLEPTLISRISALDSRLRRIRKVFPFEGPGFEDFRSLVNPAKHNWWWYPEPPSALWTVAALFFLTVSVSVLTDFTRRLLNSGPDEIGLLTIAVQAVFAVAATGSFTAAGREVMDRMIARLGFARRYRPAMKLWATIVLFAVIFCAWKFLPDRLSDYYNDTGFRQYSSNPDAARTNYGRAISLNPGNVRAHFNLGALYENAYEYDQAAGEYRKAIVVEPNHVRAYSNLSRLLLMGNDPSAALQVADDALKLKAGEGSEILAALYRNRALAEYRLALYRQAEGDAKLSSESQAEAAAPYCVLAKVYSKLGRSAEANVAWQNFLSRVNSPVLQPRFESDCIHLAQEPAYEKH
jgi:tetratricopeptide (TPR) repeat protein